MIENRSVPADILLPHIVYRDVAAAIQCLSSAFGFVEHYRYDESSSAQMHLGDAWIMVRQSTAWGSGSLATWLRTQSLTVFVEDVEAHYKRARAAGAKSIEEPN
jgi:uncharacterized glyoxalase superfamily protein PhnB